MGDSRASGACFDQAAPPDFVQLDEMAFVFGRTGFSSWRVFPDGRIQALRRDDRGVLLGVGTARDPEIYDAALAAPLPAGDVEAGVLGRPAYALTRARMQGGEASVAYRTETTPAMDEVIERLRVLAPATDAVGGARYWLAPLAAPVGREIDLDNLESCDPEASALAAPISGGNLHAPALEGGGPTGEQPVAVRGMGVWYQVGYAAPE